MGKAKTVYFCNVCGNETPKWQGKCPACGAWNTLQEHVESVSSNRGIQVTVGRREPNYSAKLILIARPDFLQESASWIAF